MAPPQLLTEAERRMMSKEELQQLLQSVPGVQACRAELDKGRISELHIIADMDKTPKQIKRDVETVLTCKDVEIDYRVISIVCMPPMVEQGRLW